MITIIIPSVGGPNQVYLYHCVNSIFHYTKGVEFRVVVVNNSSSAKVWKWPKEWENRITVVGKGTNLGFIKGMNLGLGQVKENEHVLWLNDDCVVTDPFWLQRMVGHFIDDKVGAVGPVGTNVLGPQNISTGDYKERVERPYLVGFCLLVSAEAYKAVGRLDEQFGIGMQDDLDYCIRLRMAGYKLILDRRVFIYHFGSATFRSMYPDLRQLQELEASSRALLVKKWGNKVVEELFR